MEETDIPTDVIERAALLCAICASNPDIEGETEAATLLGLEDTDPAIDLAIDAWVRAGEQSGYQSFDFDPVVCALAEAMIRTGEVKPRPYESEEPPWLESEAMS